MSRTKMTETEKARRIGGFICPRCHRAHVLGTWNQGRDGITRLHCDPCARVLENEPANDRHDAQPYRPDDARTSASGSSWNESPFF